MAFQFVDLFAGIGGFHVALGERWGGLGGECVLASELDREARRVYRTNFRMPAKGDIRKVLARHHGNEVEREDDLDDLLEGPAELPKNFDLLAAGFPCQPFSKSGRQEGLEDQTRGTLFFDICTILKERQPRFIVLENVRNIAAHDEGRTWKVIVARLHELGYKVNSKPLVFSPHLLHPDDGGAPQFRERVFILGEHRRFNPGSGLDWDFHIENKPQYDSTWSWKLDEWLEEYHALEDKLEPYAWPDARYDAALAWGDLLAKLPADCRIPQPLKVYAWKRYPDLKDDAGNDLPEWKQRHNRANAKFYADYYDTILKDWIDEFKPQKWIKSNQKFEWQAQDAARTEAKDILKLQIQFRPSGLRVKKPTWTGALVAITQTPYMGWLGRSLTPTEAASLQGIPVHDPVDPYTLHPTAPVAFKQLGNGVNAGVVRYLVTALFEHCGFEDYVKSTHALEPVEPLTEAIDLEAMFDAPASDGGVRPDLVGTTRDGEGHSPARVVDV